MTPEILIIAYCEGWCVITLPKIERVAGPYAKHEDAVQAAETRAWRIKQGWAP